MVADNKIIDTTWTTWQQQIKDTQININDITHRLAAATLDIQQTLTAFSMLRAVIFTNKKYINHFDKLIKRIENVEKYLFEPAFFDSVEKFSSIKNKIPLYKKNSLILKELNLIFSIVTQELSDKKLLYYFEEYEKKLGSTKNDS